MVDGDEVDLAGLTLRAMATPGHTDEHLSFLLVDGSTPRHRWPGTAVVLVVGGMSWLPVR
jgi:hydroxyacylglutathione hydrolase